jgi:glycosyltransferase involved in cell wall biosynthesis
MGLDRMSRVVVDMSVIICTYTDERWDYLVAAIKSVQQQTVTPKEIIVVDNNSRLLDRVRACITGVIALENRCIQGVSGARNTGAKIAKGKIIAFLDDDAVASPYWLNQHYTGYEHNNVLGIGGDIVPLWSVPRPKWFPDEFNWVVGATYNGLPKEIAQVRNVWSGNMSVRKEVFDAICGFRIGFGKVGIQSSPEDTDFCIRALRWRPHWIWLYIPAVKVWHKVPASRAKWKYYIWRCYNEGLGKARLTTLVGMDMGMATERHHMFYTLPRGFMKGLVDTLFHHDASGFRRSSAILIGLTLSAGGYFIGLICEEFAKRKPDQLNDHKTITDLNDRRG